MTIISDRPAGRLLRLIELLIELLIGLLNEYSTSAHPLGLVR